MQSQQHRYVFLLKGSTAEEGKWAVVLLPCFGCITDTFQVLAWLPYSLCSPAQTFSDEGRLVVLNPLCVNNLCVLYSHLKAYALFLSGFCQRPAEGLWGTDRKCDSEVHETDLRGHVLFAQQHDRTQGHQR